MNKQEAINKIKETLKSLMKFDSNVVENKFTEAVTNEGLKLYFDGELETDKEIFVTDENGNLAPCEDGEYFLDNGKNIVVMSGKVSEIKENTVTPDGEETPVEDANVNMAEEVIVDEETPVEVTPNHLEEKISELESKFDKMLEMISSLVDNSVELENQFQEFCKQPGGDIVKTKEVELTPEQERVQRFKKVKDFVKS